MPLKTPKDQNYKTSYWTIHTHCPNYTIMKTSLDPEAVELMEAKKKGSKALETHHLSQHLTSKHHPLENLDYTPERAETMIWGRADSKGDFVLDDPLEAAMVWHELRRDPDPKPTLDPHSPAMPDLAKLLEEAKAAKK